MTAVVSPGDAPLWIGAACLLAALGTASFIHALALPADKPALHPWPTGLLTCLRRALPALPELGHAVLRARLRQGGYFGPRAVLLYRAAQGGGALICAIAGAAILSQRDTSISATLAMSAAAGAFGAAVPHIGLILRTRRRWQAIDRALPYGLEFIALGLSAGLTVEASAFRAARELETVAPDLADELFYAACALGDSAQAGACDRPPSAEWRALAALLTQGNRHGLTLLPSLRALSNSMRAAELARCEEAVAKLGPRLTIPLILFFLPPLFLIILTPALLSVLGR